MVTLVTDQDEAANDPQWIQPTFRRTEGRDPIGLQTITIDRIMPVLAPSILALSRRARYFSFYCFLLHEYQERRQTPTNSALSQYVKEREFEYALAIQRCPRGCGETASGAVGKQTVGPIARRSVAAFQRGESVDSYLGGYGLYYRTPLRDMGLVAPAGTALGDGTTPVDVIVPTSPALPLADAFRSAISGTQYYRYYMHSFDPIPADVIAELAEHICLCRLNQFTEEQQLLRNALLMYSLPAIESMVHQRRRSFALFLHLLGNTPGVAESEGEFRRSIWDSFMNSLTQDTSEVRVATLAQWAALIAKEYMQEAFAGVWSEFCKRGLAEQPADGFGQGELETFIRRRLVPGGRLPLPNGAIEYEPDLQIAELAARLSSAIPQTGLEELRAWAAAENTAMSALVLLITLYQRLPDAQTTLRSWTEIGSMESRQHPGLLRLGRELRERINSAATVGDTISWLVRRYIVMAHENLAYSKLPDFTFRFRWEDSRLRFYNMDTGRFGLTDIRRDAFARLSQDLGYWSYEGQDRIPALTSDGQVLIEEALQ